MNFSDLMTLPFDTNTEIISAADITAVLPDTPTEVVLQFYADHGRRDDFQRTYGKLNIGRIKWKLAYERAEVLIAASMNEDFRRWFTGVSDRANKIHEIGWKCIDVRRNVREHWERHQTWLVPPVFLSATLVDSKAPLHLVEGHTRVGLLAGLVGRNTLSPRSMHRVWIGSDNAA